ncbi:hypothetical protein ACFPYM_09030 [Methylobacterium hispanicum]|uniref:hypothetical protein n=1 Tax=Methylobacterium hispanicum TaxID=270350 RepID=UPI001EE07C8D|nr:hypothetical protein [Methylobacterium hispanicum]
MTIPLDEFLETSQAPQGFGPGRSVDWILDDEGGGARANMAWDAEADVISGGVQERGAEDPVLHFVARISSAEVELVGLDGTGETSAPEDPRGILSGFRRQVRMMTASARCRIVLT